MTQLLLKISHAVLQLNHIKVTVINAIVLVNSVLFVLMQLFPSCTVEMVCDVTHHMSLLSFILGDISYGGSFYSTNLANQQTRAGLRDCKFEDYG